MGLSLLKQAIDLETEAFSISHLKKARESLTNRYRDAKTRQAITKDQKKWMESTEQKISYIATRMPATYSAVEFVLEKLKQKISNEQINSVLDLGAGPGTASWACSSVFPEIQNITLIEQDQELIEIGQRLALHSNHSHLQKSVWKQQNLLHLEPLPHDIAILSYALGELSQISEVLQASWNSAEKFLVIIEPGSQKGFSTILQAREELLKLEGNLILPCPHSNKCPIAAGDWCHFTKRVERSRMHQKCKGGTLGYEDEKFSYCVFAKSPLSAAPNRIIAHPQKRSGHVHLRLCTPDGIQNTIFSRRDKGKYKIATDCQWGDHIDF